MSIATTSPISRYRVEMSPLPEGTRGPSLFRHVSSLRDTPGRWGQLERSGQTTSSDAVRSIYQREGQAAGGVGVCQALVRREMKELRLALQSRSGIDRAVEGVRHALRRLEAQAADADQEGLASVALMLQYVLLSEPFEELEPDEWAGYFEAAEEALRPAPKTADARACSAALRRAGLSWVAMRSDPEQAGGLRGPEQANG